MRSQQRTTLSAVQSLWGHVREFRRGLGFGILLILATTVIEVVTPLIVGRAVDATSEAAQRQVLYWYCGLFLLLSVLRFILEMAQGYVIQKTGQKITHKLRCLVFSRILSFPIARYDVDSSGRLLTRVTNDVRSLGELFSSSMSVLVLDVAVILGTVVGMLLLHTKLAFAVLLPFPIALICVRYFGQTIAETYREVRARLAEINGFLGENLAAVPVIQRLTAEPARLSRFESISTRHYEASIQSVRLYSLIQPVTNVLNGITMGTLLVYGGLAVVEGSLSLGVLVAFLGYVRNIFQPIRDMIEKYNTFLSAGVSAERIAAIFDEETEGHEPVSESIAESSVPSNTSIRFEQVGFTYPGRDEPALKNVSFTVAEKSSIAIVGATGSGKSTLVRLLLRFYEPSSGKIVFGGESLATWPKAKLRRQLGVVHQENYLVEGSLRENLTLGHTGFSETLLIQACKTAQLWDLVVSRGGLDLKIQEGGTNLSSGERQLISLARILVFDPPVLILDEATSNIDTLLESKILAAIQQTLRGRTSIVIAHRLSTIQNCDSVLVFEEGQLVEQGPFEVLKQAGGVFQNFYRLYMRREAPTKVG